MKKYIFGSMLLAVTLVVASFVVQAQTATVKDLSGWAWSSNTGWLSFNGSDAGAGGGNYKVQLQTNGDLTGYAWSPNVGWIKFDGLSGYPNGGTKATVNTSNGSVTGYIRACAGTASGNCSSMVNRADGWDGWISLSGQNHGTPQTNGSGGVTYVSETSGQTTNIFLKGYSWGSDVVGWLKFNPTAGANVQICPDGGCTAGNNLTFQVNSGGFWGSSAPSVPALQDGTASISVQWKTFGLTGWTCSASISTAAPNNTIGSVTGWSGPKPLSEVSFTTGTVNFTGVTGPVSAKRTLTLTCSDGGIPTEQTISRSVDITVVPYSAPVLSCVQPLKSNTCTTGGGATFEYNSANLPANTPPTTLVNSCPTAAGTYYCNYVCQPGYKMSAGKCTSSTIEEI